MIYLISYYLIGVIVSLFMINYYRLSNKTLPKKTDAFWGIVGPWIWPLQIIQHIITK